MANLWTWHRPIEVRVDGELLGLAEGLEIKQVLRQAGGYDIDSVELASPKGSPLLPKPPPPLISRDELAFLRAIVESTDPVRRLLYADWLGERGRTDECQRQREVVGLVRKSVLYHGGVSTKVCGGEGIVELFMAVDDWSPSTSWLHFSSSPAVEGDGTGARLHRQFLDTEDEGTLWAELECLYKERFGGNAQGQRTDSGGAGVEADHRRDGGRRGL